MPFRSEKQRRFLWKNHPEIARRWSNEYGKEVKPMKFPADGKTMKKKLKHKKWDAEDMAEMKKGRKPGMMKKKKKSKAKKKK